MGQALLIRSSSVDSHITCSFEIDERRFSDFFGNKRRCAYGRFRAKLTEIFCEKFSYSKGGAQLPLCGAARIKMKTSIKSKFEVSKYMLMGALLTAGSATTAFGATDATINTDRVYVHSDTDTSASVIMLLDQGAPVSVTAIKDGYYQVTVNELEKLYINKEFIDLQGEPDFPDITEAVEEAPVAEAIVEGAASEATAEGAAAEATADGAAAEVSAEAAAEGAAIEVPAETGEANNVSAAAEAMAPKPIYAVVESDTGLNLRIEASRSAEVIAAVEAGTALDVVATGEEWTQVKLGSETGFMATEFLAIKEGTKPAQPAPSTSKGDQFISYAKQFLGTPYVWGGTNLNRGVDCSGFVYAVYKHFGITLNRTSRSMVSNGSRVKKAELQKGDLVFFDTNGSNNGSISHVGMYIGNGQFVHSSSGRTRGVTISSLSDDYYQRTYVTAARVL
jgi:cell wall-associated NlpC family hydrolase